jgi:hypothetical protein
MKQVHLTPVPTRNSFSAILDDLQFTFQREPASDFLNSLCRLRDFLCNSAQITVDLFNARGIPGFLAMAMQDPDLAPFHETFLRIFTLLVPWRDLDFSDLADPAFYEFLLVHVYPSMRPTHKAAVLHFLIDFVVHDPLTLDAFIQGDVLTHLFEIYDSEPDLQCRDRIVGLFINLIRDVVPHYTGHIKPLAGFLFTKLGSFATEPLSLLGLLVAFIDQGGGVAEAALSGLNGTDFFQACLREDLPLPHQIAMVHTALTLVRCVELLQLFQWEYILPALEYDDEDMVVAGCQLSKAVIKFSPFHAAASLETPLIPTCLAIAELGSYRLKGAAFRIMKQIVQSVPQLFWQVIGETNYLEQISDFLESWDEPRLLKIVMDSCLYLLLSLSAVDRESHNSVLSFLMEAEIIPRIEALGDGLPPRCADRRKECLVMFQVSGQMGELDMSE